jgi:hypothetical protein
LIKEFVDRMPEAARNGVIKQMAMHFGLLYAGAIFAIEIWRPAVDDRSRAKCSYARLPRRCKGLKAGRSACNGTRDLEGEPA